MMAKVIYNPDRSEFKQFYANKEYTVKPGKNKFPDKVADHLVQSLKMWGVVHYKDESSEAEAHAVHAPKVTEYYGSILDSHAREFKDRLAAGLPVPESDLVKEAKAHFSTEVSG